MYGQALAAVGLETLHARCQRQAHAFYQKMQDPRHKLHHLLPESRHLTWSQTEPQICGAEAKYLQSQERSHSLWNVQLVDPVLYCHDFYAS